MSFFAKFFSPAKPPRPRRRISGESVDAMLGSILAGRLAKNYRHIGMKSELAVITRELLRAASDRSFSSWRKGAWECEDQARAMLHEAQKLAAAEGLSWACGMLRGLPEDKRRGNDLHIWVWAVVESSRDAVRVVFFDATNRDFADVHDLQDVDFSIT